VQLSGSEPWKVFDRYGAGRLAGQRLAGTQPSFEEDGEHDVLP
jgi:hypothetical protein